MVAAPVVCVAQPDLTRPPSKACGDILNAEQAHQTESYQVDIFALSAGYYREWINLTTRPPHHADATARTDVQRATLSPDDEARFLRNYCTAHLSHQFADAMSALDKHEAAAETRAAIANVEAPEDVRDYVIKGAPQLASGHLKDEPNNDKRTGIALGRDQTGKLIHLPDFAYLLTALINGEGYYAIDERLRPLPLKGVTEVADVFIHSEIRDKPPGGNDNQLMRSGVPLFILGDRGLDVWEIGVVDGAVSVRSLSWSVIGPWEPFQSDRTKYKNYSQRYLDGRTISQDFPDPNDAALVSAACAGDRKGIIGALKAGANANAKGIEGDAPLFWTLECGKLESLETLLKAGADPNYRLAWKGQQTDIVTFPRQYSVLYNAVDIGDLNAVKLLLRFGGDPNTYDDNVNFGTALWSAFYNAEYGENAHDAHAWDIYEALLDADKDINRIDSLGQTIAITALQSRRFDKLEEILHHGYNHDLAGLADQIWHYAKSSTDPQVLRVIAALKSKGVDVPPRPVLITVRMEDDGSLDYFTENGRLHILKDDPRYDKLMAIVGPLEPGKQKTSKVTENTLPF